MSGLEISIVALSEVSVDNPVLRLDAEFFRPSALSAMERVAAGDHDTLGNLSARIQHPAEVLREYAEDGLPTVMAGNLGDNRVESRALSRLDVSEAVVAKNKLSDGDLLLTRTGDLAAVGAWKESMEAFAGADLLIARSLSAPNGYVSTYLSTRYGRPLLMRCAYGSNQPHLSPTYASLILIPRWRRLETVIDNIVDRYAEMKRQVWARLQEAESVVEEAVGLKRWSPLTPLTYTRLATNMVSAARLDAEFAAPRVKALLDELSRTGSTVGTVCEVRREKFKANPPGTFEYIEIGNLDGLGRSHSSQVDLAEAPSRASWYVRSGDVITSTVRPLRRLSAIIGPDQDGDVCSSGFVVLKPLTVSAELLMTYLRLPPVAELMHLFATASMYPALSETDLLALPMPVIANDVDKMVKGWVQDAIVQSCEAEHLLETAKRAVELAIEENEERALDFLNEEQETTVTK